MAKEFVLCDHWFSDVPGPTVPNRAFVHAATSQGYTDNAGWKPELNCDTIYDRLKSSGKSWRVYYHDHNDVTELYPGLAKTVGNNVLFDESFLSDVAGDRLASYSFITPAFMSSPQQPVNSMHAPADVRPAEKLVADVYTALQAHEEVWKKALLIIVFDECGGYFDHVRPPATVSPDDIPGHTDKPYLVPFDFQRLGLRVPCILVSPWFEAQVDSTEYSHSTIPGSVIEAFQLGDFLTKRDKGAAKLTQKYLLGGARRQWRTQTPTVTVPVQPPAMDPTQQEILEGAVNLDPHPENRNNLRTRDIRDPMQAKQFVQTQVAKHLEHYFASAGQGDAAEHLAADRQPASSTVSAARINELKLSSGKPSRTDPRP
ncbi:alkaline phosphatase family protein [Paraburkholderia sp. IMGN_8]|uniref:alkaline phosphatase family protein n=1 Tax=Paraburkholderia sp. IMGN_8 TaxID=3136564 RepID=UPI003100FA0B